MNRTKTFIAAAALLALTSSFAHASPSNSNNSNNGNTTNQGGAGGIGIGTGGNATQGQLQGQLQGQAQAAIGIGQGGSVRNSGNSSNLNANANNSRANSTSTSNSNSVASGNVSSNGNFIQVDGDSTQVNAPKIPVATAYAPNVVSTALCKFGVSGGGQGMTFGFSVGVSITDENCMLLEQVRTVSQVLGQREVAAEMMMAIPAYREAVQRLNNKSAKSAEVPVPGEALSSRAGAGVENILAEERDPIKRFRFGLPPLALAK